MKRSRVILSTIICSLILVGSASALEYQTNPSTGDNPVTLKFEFGSTLNITTGGNISISDLTPGTKAISASNYNVTVSTNNLTGYTLSATVGCSSGTDCYDSKNLSDGTNTFSMLSTDGALTAGTWGISLDSSATANSNFKTLAKYDETATIINQTTSNTGTAATGYTGTANTTVRVGAYATTSQVAGTYTNSINFIAVANAMPEFMQDMTSARMAELMPNTGDSVTLYDKRDGQDYTVAKLADGKYWMTKNLNLAGGTALSPSDTDVDASYISSFTTSNNLTKSGNTIVLPASSASGFSINNYSYVYNTSNTTDTCTNPGCYSYYSWDAATLGSGRSIATDNDAPYSICPKGWRLPTKLEYKALLGSGNTGANLVISPFFYVYSGVYYNSSFFGGGSDGFFWSSTGDSESNVAYDLVFDGSFADFGGESMYYGCAIRCVTNP